MFIPAIPCPKGNFSSHDTASARMTAEFNLEQVRQEKIVPRGGRTLKCPSSCEIAPVPAEPQFDR
jgi:hypothetical protein